MPDYNNRQESALRTYNVPHIIVITRSTVPLKKYALAVLFFLIASPAIPGQQQPQLPEISPPPGSQRRPPENEPSVPPEMQKRMEKQANQQRQTELKRDADKLFKLSTELKEYVDKSNENILSLDVIKKADEIEKLAHSVKTKMRGSD
ncbi:MAG: hypothetical protein DMG93_09715 [Acidobacteria bacterium]|nr:MAG: hypothetical protein DMG93_09715 [Acidobacteriota bacterium]